MQHLSPPRIHLRTFAIFETQTHARGARGTGKNASGQKSKDAARHIPPRIAH